MKYKTIHENEVFINPPKKELIRFTEVYDRGIGVLPHERGEYVKLEDIIAFESEISAKKIETVEELISSTPNDQELGEKVREMFG